MHIATGVEGLVHVVQDLSMAPDVATVQDIVRRAARSLTGADGATLVLRDADQCHYVDEDAIEPLWKGQRFPLSSCVSGWAMLHRTAAVIPDIYADERVPVDAYRPTFVRSMCMVPVRSSDPIGAIGNYWAEPHVPSEDEVRLLQALADTAAVALVHARVRQELDQIVADRTAEIRRLSVTDEMTGVFNRRGFLEAARAARAHQRRRRTTGYVLFADVDGLKAVNDTHGHEAGDALILGTAQALRQTLRETDVVGRWGGDELVAFAHDATDPGALTDRVVAAAAERGVTVSIGLARVEADDPRRLEELLAVADQAMYAGRHARRRLSA